jgi:hypothetical protein
MSASTASIPCQHLRVAESDVGEVALCPDCGVVSVVLAFMTLRIPLAEFGVFQGMLSRAQSRISALPTEYGNEARADALTGPESHLH